MVESAWQFGVHGLQGGRDRREYEGKRNTETEEAGKGRREKRDGLGPSREKT